jgi:alkaline phosphatase
MSSAQITAARWDKAEENLTTYANTSLNMDHFDYDRFVSTYSANSFTIDSAAAITAIATGLQGRQRWPGPGRHCRLEE